MSKVWVSSIYGYKTKQPLVEIHYQDTMLQISPTEARSLAASLLLCSEATEQDAFLIEWLQQSMSVEISEAAVVLHEYRDWRKKRKDPCRSQIDE